MHRVESSAPHFDPSAHGENVKLLSEGTAATCLFGGGEGTFAMVAGPALESGVHTLVLRLAKGNRTAFGVGTKTHEPSASNISRGMWTQWAHGAGSWDDGELVAGAPFAEAREGAEIAVTFDVEEGELSYSINGKRVGVLVRGLHRTDLHFMVVVGTGSTAELLRIESHSHL